jgi:hypothetical protein
MLMAAEFEQSKLVRYTITVRNAGANAIVKPDIWVAAPVAVTGTQKVTELSASMPYQLKTDALGNQTMHFDMAQLPPYSSKIISIKVALLMAKAPVKRPLATDKSVYVEAAPYIESANEKIVRLSTSLKGSDQYSTAQNLYRWVSANLKHRTYLPQMQGALYALDTRQGDCTEFASLLTAMSRASALPARLMAGYVYDENAVLRAVDYHNWTEIYIDGAWTVADAHQKVFNSRYASYIALRIIEPVGNAANVEDGIFGSGASGIEMTMN